ANTTSDRSTVPTFLLLRSMISTLGMAMFRPPGPLLFRPPDDHVSAVGARNGALHQDHVVLHIHLDNFKVSHRDSVRSHPPAHAHTGENARRKAGRAN